MTCTEIFLPRITFPFIALIARSAASFVAKLTKPYPLLTLVCRSKITYSSPSFASPTFALIKSPNSRNKSSRSASLNSDGMLNTNRFASAGPTLHARSPPSLSRRGGPSSLPNPAVANAAAPSIGCPVAGTSTPSLVITIGTGPIPSPYG